MKELNKLDLLEKALRIAVEAHQGQRDRYGSPYILHPLRVMCRVNSLDEKIVAILHDVVEDTKWTFADLRREGFPARILTALRCVTRKETESYEAFVRRSARNDLARKVKLADPADNMDIRRLPGIGPSDSKRLQRYLDAWRRLHGPQP